MIEKGRNNEPPIKDFFLNTLDGADSTEAILNNSGEYYFFFIKDVAKDTSKWVENFRQLYNFAKQNNRPLIIVASQATAAQEFFNVKNNFFCYIFGLISYPFQFPDDR